MALITITAENFEKEVLQAKEPVLLDFFATWCGPCRMVGPILEEIAAERPDIKVGKINVDEEGELAAKFGVVSIPSLFAVKNGQVTGQLVGAHPKAAILDLI